MRAVWAGLFPLAIMACGGPPAETSPSGSTPAASTVAEPPPPPRARATARYACDDAGWSLSYAIGAIERTCDEEDAGAELVIIQRPGGPGDAQRFEFRLGDATGEGVICRAPGTCEDVPHVLSIVDGDPPRIEWSLSLPDEVVEHGSAAVLLCNDRPPPPCELP